MKRLIIFYNFLLTLLLAGAALSQAKKGQEVIYGLIFIPMAFFFGRLLYRQLTHPRRHKLKQVSSKALAQVSPLKVKTTAAPVLEGEALDDADVADINRRMFVKLIGAAGLSTFVFALFSKSAHAAFFGSVPGPGTVSLKDSSGNKIDPAEKQPTDGYEISQVDDASMPAYYGFLHKDGAWYIAREGNGGEYRYARGSGSFSSNWSNRGSLSFDYFDSVF